MKEIIARIEVHVIPFSTGQHLNARKATKKSFLQDGKVSLNALLVSVWRKQ